MDSIFKFKKPAKKMVGEFDADDKQEWTLLKKDQIGDVTLFVHFHKLWCVTESPEIEADEDNGVEYQAAVVKQPVCEIYFGFIKDDKFVVERQNKFYDRIEELTHKKLNQNIQFYLEQGYQKDWNNYKLDEPITPNYYGHDSNKGQKTGFLMQSIHQLGSKLINKIVPANINSNPTP